MSDASPAPETDAPETGVSPSAPEVALAVGDRVRLAQAPAYFKTADPMPMLRPPDLISLGDEGEITEQRTGQTWVVRFARGAVLLDSPYLEKIDG